MGVGSTRQALKRWQARLLTDPHEYNNTLVTKTAVRLLNGYAFSAAMQAVAHLRDVTGTRFVVGGEGRSGIAQLQSSRPPRLAGLVRKSTVSGLARSKLMKMPKCTSSNQPRRRGFFSSTPAGPATGMRCTARSGQPG